MVRQASLRSGQALLFIACALVCACRGDSGASSSTPPRKIEAKTGEVAQPLALDARWVAGPGWPAEAVVALNSTLFAQNSVTVGNVAVLDASPGPTLSDSSEAVVGPGARLTGILQADTVFVRMGAVVTGTVLYNGLTNNGTIQGSLVTPLALPLSITVPVFPVFTAGAVDVELAQKEDRTLVAGGYGTITLRAGTTNDPTVLTLSGGVYNLQVLNVGDRSRVECAAACEVRIKDKLLPGSNAYVGPSAASGLSPASVQLFVEGVNGVSGNFGATPRAAVVGMSNTFVGRLYAPNGTLHLKDGTVATGTFIGRDVDVGPTVQVTKDSGGCPPSCDDGNACTADACTDGACTHTPIANGTACSDGNACTQSDSCQAGACTGSNPVVCAAPDACHVAGTCDVATGVCSNPPAADGAACDDGDACTQTDTCIAGACTGASPVTCAALDACHVAGSCDPATGACTNPPAPNGTACSDGNACTQSDSCQAGVCVAGLPVVCAAQDQCHLAGTCDPVLGACSNPAKLNGTACNDGNACTLFDACMAGTCSSSMLVQCAAADACHEAGLCDPATGQCSNTPKPDGTACNDGSACTTSDACNAGLCVGAPVVCGAADACHEAGVCNALTGQCASVPKPNGTPCDDGNLCTTGDFCNGGACTGVPQLCTPLDPCHTQGVCNPATGVCSNPVALNGTACNDLDACTQNDACQGGACTGANPVTCAASDACHVGGVCDPFSGACSNPAAADGTMCSDGNACTQSDSCQAGTCTGSNPVACAALDSCHTAGMCNPITGACSNPLAVDGTACSDGNGCTQSDTCHMGACVAGSTVPCAALDACHVSGVCNPMTGACSNPVAPDGTACNDGNGCTQSDACQAGTCTGANPVVCTAPDACHTAGTCDPATGACVSSAIADGGACSDGNPCTTGETCTGGACGGGTAVTLDDGSACTVDACDPVAGVTHVAAADGTACGDGNACNGAETCLAGVCTAGTPVACAASDACHTVACDPATGACVSSAVADGGPCNDGNACTTGEICSGGACGGGSAVAVDDDNPCTVDACDPVAGVTHVAVADGAACPDGNVCNGDETCLAGVCTVGTPLSLDDGNPATFDSCDPIAGVQHLGVAPLDLTVATTIAAQGLGYYTGPMPLQTRLDGTRFPLDPPPFDDLRAAILHGRVQTMAGAPLSGVTVTVLKVPGDGDPAIGKTQTRADGAYELVVEGGRPLTVVFAKMGYFGAQRMLTVLTLDHARVPDVILVEPDPIANELDLDSAIMQVAEGSVSTDESGTRRATVLVPAGTTMTVPDGQGGQVALPGTVHLRATEFTVGAGGPRAMPAELPPTSGYTYALELSVDEAGDKPVSLNQPLAFYVENFIHMPVGTRVPVGFYDRAQGAWVAEDNGLTIKLLGLDAGGLATVDTDGDDLADDALALSLDERTELALRYAPGSTLWRVPIPHLTPWDCNLPYGPGPDDEPPPPKEPRPGGPGPKGGGSGGGEPNGGGDGSGGDGPGGPNVPDPKIDCGGSGIECQNQTLHESVPLTGLPYDLHYASDRGAGRKEPYTLFIPLSDGTVPATLSSIALTIDIAGQHIAETFPATPDQSTTFVWNGKDNVGRVLQGAQPVTVRVGYVYPAVYMKPAEVEKAFAQVSGLPMTADRARLELTFWRNFSSTLGELRADLTGLGGLSLGIHHFYDPGGRQLWLGDGTRRSADALAPTIRTVAGGGARTDDGAPALDLSLRSVRGVAAAPNGDIYVLDLDYVWRIGPDGVARKIAGVAAGWGCPEAGFCLDDFPTDLAVAPDGTIYVAGRYMVVRLRPDQGATFEVVAGNGYPYASPDSSGPAANVAIGQVGGIALGPDGTLYMTQNFLYAAPNYIGSYGSRVRAVTPDGMLRTIAGGGLLPVGDGVPATQAMLSRPFDVTVAPDGGVVFDDGRFLRKVGSDGLLTTVAGDGTNTRVDGVLATASGVTSPVSLAHGPSGQFVFADVDANVIRTVSPSRIIRTLAGTGDVADSFTGEGGPAVAARFDAHLQPCAAVGRDGSVYVCDSNRVLRIQPPLPGLTTGEILVPSADGQTGYVFSGVGRHLRTVEPRTGATLQTFAYDMAGRLASITDAFGNVTAITYDDAARTGTITAPYGQATLLQLDPATGLLASATSPAGETHAFGYDADGRLTSFTNPRSLTAHMAYYANGRLHSDTDAASATLSFGSGVDGDGWTVKKTSPMSELTTYHTVIDAVGGKAWRSSFADGTQALVVQGADLAKTTTVPNGEIITTKVAPDPRFGLAGAFESERTTTTPGGLVLQTSAARTAVATGLVLQSQTDTFTVNGQASTTVFDAVYSMLTRTSPMGRTSVTTLDAFGRAVASSVPAIASTAFVYDRERVASVTQAGHTTAYAYDAQGQLASITDALTQATSFGYDAAGRRTSTVRADGESTLMTYDGNGNLTSVTPPGQPAHVFTYTAVDLVESYSAPPPSLGEPASTTTYAYDLDRKLASVTRPDASLVQYGYDAIRRLASISHPSLGVIAYGYDAKGRLGTIGGPDGTLITYGYDGHLLTDVAWTGSITGAFHRDFDAFFRPAAESVNGSPVAAFQYDADGLLIAAGDLTLHRDPATGKITDTVLAGGQLVDSTQYDPDFGLVAHYAATVGATELYGYDITGRDALGRITTKTERTQGEVHGYSYAYDVTGRLTDVWKDGNDLMHRSAHYAYDANGNRLAKTTPAGTVGGTYDAQDRIKTYGTLSYVFTANGELASKTDTASGDVTAYTYDARGDLKRVVLHAGGPTQKTIDYVVDGLSHRMWKRVDGVAVKGWLYRDALAPIAELDGAGNVTARFVYGTKVNVPEYVITASGRFRVVTDHLGSPHVVVDEATGAVVMRADYDEFGNVTVAPEGAAGTVPFGFAGGIWDPETGLVRFGARDYDAVSGRWTAKDPLIFDGGYANLYAYIGNDAIGSSDPSGLCGVGSSECNACNKKRNDDYDACIKQCPEAPPGPPLPPNSSCDPNEGDPLEDRATCMANCRQGRSDATQKCIMGDCLPGCGK